MNDKLRDAIDSIQTAIDDHDGIDIFHHENIQLVLEAAWAYWDLLD